VEVGDGSSPIQRIVEEWYASNTDITRLWVYEAGAPDSDTRTISMSSWPCCPYATAMT
jgi:hypothetical protein